MAKPARAGVEQCREQHAGDQQQQAGRGVQDEGETHRDREDGQRQGKHATPHRPARRARGRCWRHRGRHGGSRLWRHGTGIPSNYRFGGRLAMTSSLSYCIPGCGARRLCQRADSPRANPSNGRSDMSTEYAGREERLHTAEVFRDKWVWLVLLGSMLIAACAAAVLVPAVSAIAASKVLVRGLIISGILPIMQAAKMLHCIAFILHMLLGILAAIGGLVIFMDSVTVDLTLIILIS